MAKRFPLYLIIFFLIFLFVFRNLILNLSTNLLDWRDYPYIIWIISQNFNHLVNLDFANFFETNAFYPNKLTLLFSDLLLPQSIILLPLLLITKNIILSFNITFILTFILNFIASFFLWKQIFKNELIAFIGSLFLIFSPFLHLEISHFQMLTFWPLLLALYFLFKHEEKEERKYLIFVGLFLTIQFLASVYLSIYLIVSIVLFYCLKFIFSYSPKTIGIKIFLIFFVFLATSGVFIKAYTDMKNTYSIKRDIKEYITYSAHLSDYVFTSQIKSIIHQSTLMQLWNKADKNWSLHSSFPGFLIFLLSLFGLFKISKKKNFFTINIQINKEKGFFLILVILGFIFSLGPRVNFNGNYAHIPLPYDLVIKFMPFAEALRVPSRWSFIFFLGLTYLALVGLTKLLSKFKFKVITLVLIFFSLELIPINIQSSAEEYIDSGDHKLKELCTNRKEVLLKIPVTHMDVSPDIVTGLNYIAKAELASTYHNCLMVNGYSGYDLPRILDLKDKINNAMAKKDVQTFLELIKINGVSIVEFRPDLFTDELKKPGEEFIEILTNRSEVIRTEDIFIIR